VLHLSEDELIINQLPASSSTMLPLCFVLMPFGKKPAGDGRLVDFDSIYEHLIKPAVVAAGLEPLRADEEMTGGVIHKPMFERLILCEYAVADLTTANANVFYELGLRHAVRQASTVLLFAQGIGQLPFDVAPLRAMPYQLGPDGKPAMNDTDREILTAKLREARKVNTDSPVFQLVEEFPDIQRLKTDVFRERVEYSDTVRQKLAQARKQGIDAVRAVEREIGPIHDAEVGVVVDLFLSYRAVKGWDEMIALGQNMSAPLAATVLVQEQLGLALNRANRGEEAERILLALIASRGPSSETFGILGRVYKDRWDAALKAGEKVLARRLLEKAIDAYFSVQADRARLSWGQRLNAHGTERAARPQARAADPGRLLRRGTSYRLRQAGLLGPRHATGAGGARQGSAQGCVGACRRTRCRARILGAGDHRPESQADS
jgi:hypothetical protein